MLSLFYSLLAYLPCKCSCNLAASLSKITEYSYFSLKGNMELFGGVKA